LVAGFGKKVRDRSEKSALPAKRKPKMKTAGRCGPAIMRMSQKLRPPGWGDIRAANQIDARGRRGACAPIYLFKY
jgi:hypothetical protein